MCREQGRRTDVQGRRTDAQGAGAEERERGDAHAARCRARCASRPGEERGLAGRASRPGGAGRRGEHERTRGER